MTERKEADLLPWIFGVVVVAIAAVGLIVASTHKDDLDAHSPQIRVAPEPGRSEPNAVPARPRRPPSNAKAINERMRHPYTNPEGEYYRDRLHKISDRKYDLHCDR